MNCLPNLCQDRRCGWSGGGFDASLGAEGRGLLILGVSLVRNSLVSGGYGKGRNTLGIGRRG